MLRYLFVLVLVCGLAGVAKADDFKVVIVDPTVPLDLLQPITSDNFTVDFPTTGAAAGCQDSTQLPGVTDAGDYSACFTGINLTGKPLTSIDIEFPIFNYPGTNTPDTPSCPIQTSVDDFKSVTCGTTNGGADYLLQFSGGDIPTATIFNSYCYFDPFPDVDCSSPAIFTIAIGIPGINLIQDGTIQQIESSGIVAEANVVPEPNSFLLMATGVLSLGMFGVYRRRQVLASPQPPNQASHR
jgi:hypothetical protein